MFTHCLKIAWRNIVSHKAEYVISVIGLSIGMLCFSICLHFSRFILDTDSCFQHRDRICVINNANQNGAVGVAGVKKMAEMEFQEIEAITYVEFPDERNYEIEIEDDKRLPYEHIQTLETDSSFMKVFTPKVLYGSWRQASLTPNALVMSESFAKKVFGEASNAIGRQMVLTRRLATSPESTPRNGGIVYTIQAVVEDFPVNNSLNFLHRTDIYTLNDSEGILQSIDYQSSQMSGRGFVLRKADVELSDLQEMLALRKVTYQMFFEDFQLDVLSLQEAFLYKDFAHISAWILFVIGLLILLTALLNIFQLLGGNFLNRLREFGVRQILGSSKKQLFYLLSIQIGLVCVVACFLSSWQIELLEPWLKFDFNGNLLEVNSRVLLLQTAEYMVVILAVGLSMSGLLVHKLQRNSVINNLSFTHTKQGKRVLRTCLLGVQFFICWIFLSFTAGLYLQVEKVGETLFQTLSDKDKSEILSFSLEYSFLNLDEKQALVNRMASYDNVMDYLVAPEDYLLSGVACTSIQTEYQNRDTNVRVDVVDVSPNFFTFMQIPLVAGQTMEGSMQQMVVDEHLAKRLQLTEPGKTVYNYEGAVTICGIAKDFVFNVQRKSDGYIFLPLKITDSFLLNHCYLKCKPGQVEAVKAQLTKELREILPENLEPEIMTLKQGVDKVQALENTMKQIILFFALVSLVITALGVYSAISMDTQKRQKEVAIRKINGANTKDIILLFAKSYGWILLVSALLAFPVCHIAFMQWKNLYTVFFQDGALFWLMIAAGVTIFTALTIFYRIRKIIRINPAEVIKYE